MRALDICLVLAFRTEHLAEVSSVSYPKPLGNAKQKTQPMVDAYIVTTNLTQRLH